MSKTSDMIIKHLSLFESVTFWTLLKIIVYLTAKPATCLFHSTLPSIVVFHPSLVLPAELDVKHLFSFLFCEYALGYFRFRLNSYYTIATVVLLPLRNCDAPVYILISCLSI